MNIKRCPLSKRIPREMTGNFGKYIGMTLILICTICIGSAFQSTLNGAFDYLDMIKEDNCQEDGFFEVTDKIKEDSYYSDNKINLYENFYVTENSFADESKVIVFNERKDIDIPTVFEGKMPKEKDEIALDHVFANGKKIKVGDTISLLNRDLKVSGTVSLPDYTSLFLNNTDLVMNTSHFCVGVVSKETFDTFDRDAVTYRYSYRS